MYLSLGIVPIKSEVKIACSFPVSFNLIVLFEYADEMLNNILVDVLHPKIVDNEAEADGTPVVLPVTWCGLTLGVPCFVESFGE